MNADQTAMKKALDDITADFVAAKETFVADPSSENYHAKKAQAAQLQAARKVWRENRPAEPADPARFGGNDAEAFLPEDQGGNTARALVLLAELFAARGDPDDPQTVLNEMRANIIANRSI